MARTPHWCRMPCRVRSDSPADCIALPEDVASAERMKTALYNCHGKLHCQWAELRCEHPLPGATAGARIQSCAYDTEAMLTVIESILIPNVFGGLRIYPNWSLIFADEFGSLLWEALDESDASIAPSEDQYNLRGFRDDLFDFAMGGRILGLWPSGWHTVSDDDRDHVCSMSLVSMYCVSWVLEHPADMEEVAKYALTCPTDSPAAVRAKLKKLVAAKLVDPSVALSGPVDMANLPPKSSARSPCIIGYFC
jgi:hypothetical protein